MFNGYKNYIKDNPEGYWFKRKIYGWGWTPVKWQGWTVIIGFIALIIFNFRRLDAISVSENELPADFLLQTVVLVILLIAICYVKGERPRWQWGLPDKYKNK